MIILTTAEIIIIDVGKAIFPSRAERNPSTMPVIGLRAYIRRNFSGTIDAGYTMGEANIQSCTRNGMVNLISLYLAFRAAKNMPMPLAVNIINITRSGVSEIMAVGYR